MDGRVALDMIKRCFAGREADIERAFRTGESFRGLCTDYLACATALARWRESGADEAPTRVREYSELLRELTKEIHAALLPHPGEFGERGSRTIHQHEEEYPR